MERYIISMAIFGRHPLENPKGRIDFRIAVEWGEVRAGRDSGRFWQLMAPRIDFSMASKSSQNRPQNRNSDPYY